MCKGGPQHVDATMMADHLEGWDDAEPKISLGPQAQQRGIFTVKDGNTRPSGLMSSLVWLSDTAVLDHLPTFHFCILISETEANFHITAVGNRKANI